jgi:anti-sigma B factor antagonist
MALTLKSYQKELGVIVVEVGGSLDSATYQELEKKLKVIMMGPVKALILDMKSLDYISSMGVSVVLKTKKAIEASGGSFMMVNLQHQIKTVFDIVKALPNMCLFESLEEADNYLAEMQRRAKEQTPDDGRGYKL